MATKHNTRPRGYGRHIPYRQEEVDRWSAILDMTPATICKKADLNKDMISSAKHIGYYLESNYNKILDTFPKLKERAADIKEFSVEELQNELFLRHKMSKHQENVETALDMAFENVPDCEELVARLKKSCELCIRAYMEEVR